ncbi:unnamed protein product [Lupinus luteus]|uniref:Uncharacterized protein n=1 Tax=Lupinus luteus TaxID=3873 RepID=A0AAV1YJX3_LUPLU
MVRAPFYDKSGVKKGAWSREEDERLRDYVQRYGHSNWRKLPKLAGRTDNEIKNHWHSHLKKSLMSNDITTSDLKSKPGHDPLEQKTTHQFEKSESLGDNEGVDLYHIFESSPPMSTEQSYINETHNYSLTSNVAQSTMNDNTSKEDIVDQWVTFEEFGSGFWTEPFIVEHTYTDNEIRGDEGLAFFIPHF